MHELKYLPQKGIPSGTHAPFSHTRLAGPNNSNPLSQEYDAMVPSVKFVWENTTVLWAGEPGKLQCADSVKNKETYNYFNNYKEIK